MMFAFALAALAAVALSVVAPMWPSEWDESDDGAALRTTPNLLPHGDSTSRRVESGAPNWRPGTIYSEVQR